MPTELIQKFFEEFNRAANALDADVIATQFADVFMHADPTGVRPVKKEDFLGALGKRKAFFDALGLQSSTTTVAEETSLSDDYTLVKAHVLMRFKKLPEQPIDLEQDATYILSMKDDKPTIVFYLNHQDLMNILKEAGITP